ncbi:hypothetical protein C4N16_00795 [Fusobacterium gonidiaformans ATCC 25563]|nr:hypothetical protein C4N16_00795 [Fusobacterium gonidiaformans ATCC 25563]AVQ20536.1 hypothetical protein C4N15_02330 [Fusobacterium necrophorum subsp. funduliforme]EHO20638.1 hypothetical protein HMPREF9466_00929 [Fusobacterium necrophorum subsp. funduliforme 1_1_36S]KMV76201.1 hypothetical protein FGAG_01657 [Fusobacterium gonidiaformans ATCC 25563]
MNILAIQSKIIETIYSNKNLILLFYISISLCQVIYLRYYFTKNNLFLFIANKGFSIFFVMIEFISNKNPDGLGKYMLLHLFLYFIISVKERRKIVLRIERFLSEDILIIGVVILLISYIK